MTRRLSLSLLPSPRRARTRNQPCARERLFSALAPRSRVTRFLSRDAFDHKNKRARLSLSGEEVLHTLQEKGERINPNHPTLWRPEYGSYMIEGTPGQPYGGTMSEFNTVQDNMRKRRQEAASVLKKDEAVCTVTSFPRLGCLGFTIPEYHPTPIEMGASKSLFFPDEAINKHPRFSTLTRNIRHRRGEKVIINVPIFKDKNTPSPFIETFPSDDGEAARAAKADHVYMDAMGFGMGNCCLQVTFQACSIFEARYLYDQLATICPIVMALSAAAPFYRGYVTDIDCRWGVISASVDDRTREERGLEPLKNNRFRINKSRYDSIDSYLSECGEKYNDIDLTIDKEIYEHLVKEGIDHLLAQHIAHLFIRDPLTLFEEKIHLDDANESDHFETMRFKPPPPNSDIGWRVEFRPMEVQLTDFENSAYVVFVVLLTRVILSYKLDFLIPLSKVDENMEVAQKRDAVRRACGNAVVDGCGATQNGTETDVEEYTLMSIDTIINGKPLKNNRFRINKSRYDSIDSYLSECGEKYNDIDLTIDKEIYEHLVKEDIGWRVEFRPMEVQLTDFENSAYVVFVVLLTRVILSYKLDFLIPLSKVDENMEVAQKRDAVRQGMFYFRKDISKGGNAVVDGCGATQNGTETDVEEYTLMSIDTIINGKEGVFPGLIPILNSYLENMEVDAN
ncbi:hypothetical protein E2320_019483 [Naja naja]|nr:hypothetical protein E2320_019483 [Naja naja]